MMPKMLASRIYLSIRLVLSDCNLKTSHKLNTEKCSRRTARGFSPKEKLIMLLLAFFQMSLHYSRRRPCRSSNLVFHFYYISFYLSGCNFDCKSSCCLHKSPTLPLLLFHGSAQVPLGYAKTKKKTKTKKERGGGIYNRGSCRKREEALVRRSVIN